MNESELIEKGYIYGGKNTDGNYYYKWVCNDCNTKMRMDKENEKRKCPDCQQTYCKIQTYLIPYKIEEKKQMIEKIEVRKLSVLEQVREQRGL